MFKFNKIFKKGDKEEKEITWTGMPGSERTPTNKETPSTTTENSGLGFVGALAGAAETSNVSEIGDKLERIERRVDRFIERLELIERKMGRVETRLDLKY
ncbi:MAG: hypothetical protein JSW08_02795 [archaeon]|nr:MAG: hypothetical protein JSW08_02795 [archaeon]